MGFWMTKHLYLTAVLLTPHGKGPEKVNVNIVCFLQTAPEYHIWWVTSPCSQNSKDICFVSVRVSLWEPDNRWAQRKRQIVACELLGLFLKKECECEARTPYSSHWSFQTNYIHATPNIKWQGSSVVMRFGTRWLHMNEKNGLDSSVISGQFCDKKKEYQDTIWDILKKKKKKKHNILLLFVG